MKHGKRNMGKDHQYGNDGICSAASPSYPTNEIWPGVEGLDPASDRTLTFGSTPRYVLYSIGWKMLKGRAQG